MRASTIVGIVANPASARDIRRIVAHGGATTTHDKVNSLRRVMAGLAAAGVTEVLSMADRGGITAGLARLVERESAAGWPKLRFVDQMVTQTPVDTTNATMAMVETGVGAIVVLGGDGTNGIVAESCGDIPLVSISTGTNNAFPRPVEPTVAGLAAGLVAIDGATLEAGTYRAKKLVLECGQQREEALVDVAITSDDLVGSGAVWEADSISELFLAFAEPDAIGLSAIGGHIRPTGRQHEHGLALRLGRPADRLVTAPIAPGLLSTIGVKAAVALEVGSSQPVHMSAGVIAIDGERRVRFGPETRPTVTLRADGPRVVDVKATLAYAATSGLLAEPTRTQPNSTNPNQ